MENEKDILYVYGEKTRKVSPIEPMTAEELKINRISQNRKEEFDALMNMCETSCDHCGTVWKQYTYDRTIHHSLPFICNIDAADRICQGKCSKYSKHFNFNILEMFKRRKAEPMNTLETYNKSFSEGRYEDKLDSFDWSEAGRNTRPY